VLGAVPGGPGACASAVLSVGDTVWIDMIDMMGRIMLTLFCLYIPGIFYEITGLDKSSLRRHSGIQLHQGDRGGFIRDGQVGSSCADKQVLCDQSCTFSFM
jgi:hypothetical protein